MVPDGLKTLELECDQCNEPFTHEIEGSGRIPKRCLKCRTRDPKGRDMDYRKRKARGRLVARCSTGDAEMVDFIQETLGVTQGEALRTAVRVYYAILIQQRR